MKILTRYQKLNLLFFFVCLQIPLTVLAQDPTITQSSPNPFQIIPPSPEAASLGKYGDIPISYHTGTANISVPIYEIKGLELSVPVTLEYHSGGIRVDEIASSVGLGWALNAGGVISRTIHGLPDEITSIGLLGGQTFNDDGTPYLPECVDPSDDSYYYKQLLEGELDSQPDQFYFNFLGKSGKFVLDPNGNVHLASQEKLTIQHPFNGPVVSQQWIIQDENGVKYIFGSYNDKGATERSRVNPFCSYTQSLPSPAPKDGITSWYLLAIISPQKSDIITFNYEPYTMKYSVSGGGLIAYRTGGTVGSHQIRKLCQKNEITLWGTRLKSIESVTGSIEFQPSSSTRCDVESFGSDPKALQKIVVRNYQSQIIKEFELTHSYFGPATEVANCDNSGLNLRLKLEQVQEKNGAKTMPPYKFTYNTPPGNTWPSTISNSQDHWGYYNGASNPSLIPLLELDGTSYGEANREPSFDHAQMASLQSIQYPTGGTTTFTYELNHYFSTTSTTDRTISLLNSVYVNTYQTYPTPISSDNSSFTLTEASEIQIQCNFNCTNPGGFIGCGKVTLTYPDNTSIEYSDCPASNTLTLNPGTYDLSAEILDGEAEIEFKIFKVTESVITTEDNADGSGLRIAKTIDSDGINPDIVKEYKYTLDKGTSQTSSGQLMKALDYTDTYTWENASYNGGTLCDRGGGRSKLFNC